MTPQRESRAVLIFGTLPGNPEVVLIFGAGVYGQCVPRLRSLMHGLCGHRSVGGDLLLDIPRPRAHVTGPATALRAAHPRHGPRALVATKQRWAFLPPISGHLPLFGHGGADQL